MSATISPSIAAKYAPKRAPRSNITVTADVDVDITEFDDDAILARAAEIGHERGAVFDDCFNVPHMAAAAYLAYVEGNQREFDRLAREIIGDIVGKFL